MRDDTVKLQIVPRKGKHSAITSTPEETTHLLSLSHWSLKTAH